MNRHFVLLRFCFFFKGYCILHVQALIFLQSNVSYSDSWGAWLYLSIVVSFLVPCGRAAVSLHGDGNWSARSQGHVVWTKPWKMAGEWNRCELHLCYSSRCECIQPNFVVVQGSNCWPAPTRFYVHDSWPTGLRVWRFLCDHILVITSSRKALLTEDCRVYRIHVLPGVHVGYGRCR